jgi:hypothetical protein
MEEGVFHYQVRFPAQVTSQVETILEFVEKLHPCAIYRPSAERKPGGKGMNQIRAARIKEPGKIAKSPFLIIKPRRDGARVEHAGHDNTEKYDLPCGSDVMRQLLQDVELWHQQAGQAS